MENQSFSTWNGDELIDILINARIPFDSTRRTDTEYLREHVSQMFVDPNQSDYNPEHISMNVRLLHEQHRDDVNKLHEILGSLMGAVEDLEIQEWEHFVNGMKQELATLNNESRQHDCSLMFIGDTGAGKCSFPKARKTSGIVG